MLRSAALDASTEPILICCLRCLNQAHWSKALSLQQPKACTRQAAICFKIADRLELHHTGHCVLLQEPSA